MSFHQADDVRVIISHFTSGQRPPPILGWRSALAQNHMTMVKFGFYSESVTSGQCPPQNSCGTGHLLKKVQAPSLGFFVC